MAKTVTVSHLGMEGEGPSAAKAKKNAEERIEAVLFGEWNPYTIVHQGFVAIIARQPVIAERQWGFKVVNATVKEPQYNQMFDLNYKDRPAAIRAAAYSLAQQSGTYVGLKPFLLETQLYELDYYFNWQAAYRLAKVAGKPDHDARREADELMDKRSKVAA